MLHIVTATFGPVDVTERIRALVSQDSLFTPIHTNIVKLFGDPAPGLVKYLTITYQIYDSPVMTRRYAEWEGCIIEHVQLGLVLPKMRDMLPSVPTTAWMYVNCLSAGLVGKVDDMIQSIFGPAAPLKESKYRIDVVTHDEMGDTVRALLRQQVQIHDISAITGGRTVILSQLIPTTGPTLVCYRASTIDQAREFERHLSPDPDIHYALLLSGVACPSYTWSPRWKHIWYESVPASNLFYRSIVMAD